MNADKYYTGGAILSMHAPADLSEEIRDIARDSHKTISKAHKILVLKGLEQQARERQAAGSV